MYASAIQSSAHGLQQNLYQFSKAAQQIADSEGGGTVQSVVDLKTAEAGAKANVAVLKVANQISDRLVDIIA